MAIVKHFICDRNGEDVPQEPGKYALFDVAFYTGNPDPRDSTKQEIKIVQLCKADFDAVYKFATTPGPV